MTGRLDLFAESLRLLHQPPHGIGLEHPELSDLAFQVLQLHSQGGQPDGGGCLEQVIKLGWPGLQANELEGQQPEELGVLLSLTVGQRLLIDRFDPVGRFDGGLDATA